MTAIKLKRYLWGLMVLPQRSRESRDTAQKGEGDDDEEEGEEGWHVVTGRATLSCYGQTFLSY